MILKFAIGASKGLTEKFRSALASPRFLLCMAGCILTVLAACDFRANIPGKVFHHFVVFDITQSMNVLDIQVGKNRISRLQYSKELVIEALTDLPCGSEVALGIFTGHRSLVLFKPVEVCKHYTEISSSVNAIDWRMAWEARSEVSKGLFSALTVSRSLRDDALNVIFLTDGHEAPPLHNTYRPKYSEKGPSTTGAVVGVGGTTPVPIPQYSYEGKFIGFWKQNQVLQVDSYSLGRSTNDGDVLVGVDNENMQEKIDHGTEHLSSLKEPHLQELSRTLALNYVKVTPGSDLKSLLQSAEFASDKSTNARLAPYFATPALLCFVLFYLWSRLKIVVKPSIAQWLRA